MWYQEFFPEKKGPRFEGLAGRPVPKLPLSALLEQKHITESNETCKPKANNNII